VPVGTFNKVIAQFHLYQKEVNRVGEKQKRLAEEKTSDKDETIAQSQTEKKNVETPNGAEDRILI